MGDLVKTLEDLWKENLRIDVGRLQSRKVHLERCAAEFMFVIALDAMKNGEQKP